VIRLLSILSTLAGALDKALAAWREAKQREAGRLDERTASQARIIEQLERAHDVDRRIDGLDAAGRRRLRDKWTAR